MTSRRTRGPLALAWVFVSVVAVLAAGATNPGSSAAAAVRSTALPPTGAGIDVSYPQCLGTSHEDFPTNVPFAVIGVNGGKASNSNPCFASEYNSASLLAGPTDQPHVAVYVNTGNPALTGLWWPASDNTESGTAVVNPNGPCQNLAGAACAYIYGYSMAQADYRRVRDAVVRVPGLWWLDVETSNTWQPDVVANSASLSGMVDYFKSKHLDVGLYSTGYQWNKIAGVTPETSTLAGLPSWLAGSSFTRAADACQRSPLTPGGRVAMIQYVLHLDNNYSCSRFAATSAAILSAAPSAAGDVLQAVSGNWAPSGVSYSYQWNRNGAAIPDAIGKTYALSALDAGAQVSVTITGFKSGYSTASATSDGVAVSEP